MNYAKTQQSRDSIILMPRCAERTVARESGQNGRQDKCSSGEGKSNQNGHEESSKHATRGVNSGPHTPATRVAARACAKRAPARKETPAGATPARSSGCDHQSRFSLPLRYERSVHLASTA